MKVTLFVYIIRNNITVSFVFNECNFQRIGLLLSSKFITYLEQMFNNFFGYFQERNVPCDKNKL